MFCVRVLLGIIHTIVPGPSTGSRSGYTVLHSRFPAPSMKAAAVWAVLSLFAVLEQPSCEAATTKAPAINWDAINAKLPYQKTEEEKKKREVLWKQIDVNSNGVVSLAEATRGVRDVLNIPEVFDAVPAINRAFHFARNISTTTNGDYVEFSEFRLFLKSLREYFEYFQAFERVDKEGDRRISKQEFTEPTMKQVIEKWVGPVADMGKEFDAIDVNGGGQILFSEFVDWALKKNLDLEDDKE